MPTLTRFADQQPSPAYDHPRPDRLLRGNPLRTTWEHFTASGINAGIWACEPGAWRIAFAPDKHEFFCIITGRIRITGDDGAAGEFGPGDAGIIPASFSGSFEVLESVRKHYLIVEGPG